MLTWIIIGAGLPDLKIRAKTVYEAVLEARLRDAGYNGGYAADDEDEDE